MTVVLVPGNGILPGVCQAPVGMKQNCSDPDNLMLFRTLDSTSEGTSAGRPSGFLIKAFGEPAKDHPPSLP
jgi:hypothetical protein